MLLSIKKNTKYVIVDIPPSLYVSTLRLRKHYPDLKIFHAFDLNKKDELKKAINDNDMNSTFVGQPFYTDFDNDDPCVCIELGDVNGVRGYEKLLMLVNDDIELMYALYDAGGVRWSLTDNVRDTLDYTCDRDEEEED